MGPLILRPALPLGRPLEHLQVGLHVVIWAELGEAAGQCGGQRFPHYLLCESDLMGSLWRQLVDIGGTRHPPPLFWAAWPEELDPGCHSIDNYVDDHISQISM